MMKTKQMEFNRANFLLILGYLVSLAAAVYSSTLQGNFIDTIERERSFSNIIFFDLGKMLLVTIVTTIINMVLAQFLPLRLQLRTSISNSVYAVKGLLRLPQSKYEEREKGYYINLVTNSSFTCGTIYGHMNVELIGNILCVVALLIVSAFINPLFLVAYGIYIPTYAILSNVPNRKIADYQKRGLGTQDSFLDEAKRIVENKRSINVSKSNSYFVEKYKEKSKAYLDFVTKYRWYEILSTNMPHIMSEGLVVFTMGIAAYLYFQDKATLGTIFLMYQLSKMLQTPMKECFAMLIHKEINTVHIERMEEFDKSCNETSGFEQLYADDKNLVSMSEGKFYATEEKEVELFEGEKLVIPKKTLTLIKGQNGTGKSTFLNYISGYSGVKSFEGNITIDNSLKNAAYLTYPIIFVDGDLKENMFGKEMNRELLKTLNIAFENKEISGKITNLSFGEQQKVNLLRVLSDDAEVVLLDEPFTNLDADTIEKLAEYLGHLKEKKSIIAIVHSNELDPYADQILEIKDLKIAFQ